MPVVRRRTEYARQWCVNEGFTLASGALTRGLHSLMVRQQGGYTRCIRSVHQVGASGLCVRSVHQLGRASGRRINSPWAHTLGAHTRAVRVRSVHQFGRCASGLCIRSGRQVGASGRRIRSARQVGPLALGPFWRPGECVPLVLRKEKFGRRGGKFSRGLGRSFDRAWGKRRGE